MNHFISGIIKIILLEASVALLLIDAVAGDRFEKVRLRAHGVLAGLMVFAWCNYGAMRHNLGTFTTLTSLPVILGCAWLIQAAFGTAHSPRMAHFREALGRRRKAVALALVVALSGGWVAGGVAMGRLPLVHPWEQFHFYFGAKYQREVGWFNLYKAALLADRETVNVLAGVQTTRDLTNFEQVKPEVALADAPAVRARFSDEAWASFKADWALYTRLFPVNWSNVVNDHGNSNSPTWSLLAAPLTRLIPVSPWGMALLGWLDMLLMLGLWLVVWQTFGHRVASVGLFFWAAPPIVFDYLAGSLLRWDWLFALGLAACFLERNRPALAGGFFGYAVATKLFPLFFGLALGLKALTEYLEHRKIRAEHLRFARGAVLVGAACVALSALAFGPSSWAEYYRRIEVAQHEKFYAIQYSLKTVYLQFAASPLAEWSQTIFPSDIKQRRDDVSIDDHRVGFMLVQLAFTALIAVLARRATDTEAFVLGPLLVFTWLTVNMYYWNMLGLLTLGLVARADRQRPAMALLIGLHVIFIVFYLYQHLNRGLTEGFAVAYLLAALIVGVALWERSEQKSAVPS
jgi:hypothetical protein